MPADRLRVCRPERLARPRSDGRGFFLCQRDGVNVSNFFTVIGSKEHGALGRIDCLCRIDEECQVLDITTGINRQGSLLGRNLGPGPG